MSNDSIETWEVNGYVVHLYYDDHPESPREWSNLGTITCWHRRYTIGDKHNFADSEALFASLIPQQEWDILVARRERAIERAWNDLGSCSDPRWATAERAADRAFKEGLAAAAERHAVILPVYMYDHSGIALSTGGFSCPWDSGQIGYVWASRDTILKEWSRKKLTKKLRAKAEEVLKQEVETLSQYHEGQVYGFVVETPDGEHIDSCWGIYGFDYAKEEATASANGQPTWVPEDDQSGDLPGPEPFAGGDTIATPA